MGRDRVSRSTSPVIGRHDPLPEGDAKHVAVEAMFDRVAPGYERMNRIISLGLDRRWRRRAIEMLELAPGARVLDLACGTGDLCRDLTAAGCAAVGVDFSAGMLNAAHVRSPLVRGDAAMLPFGASSFDGVVCGFALRNFVDLEVVFRECARMVRPGGRFVALDAAVPEHLVMRLGNAVWFRGAVPVLGRLLSRDPSAYRYLPRSTAYLPDGPELIASLERAGFSAVTRDLLTGGSVQLLTGTRS
ncbi:MAG: ubiquinone/menaquinone biosynthesis methyltransferase [Acidimicrobiia bacterium]|nr:ubiquinone/menaquinone biosynthesis methyltransferase [Acidimicrobiia bacterium]